VTAARTAKRVARLEALAAARLPLPVPAFEEGGWLRWLTCCELQRLELLFEAQVGEVAEAAVPDDLYRRALGRAVMGADIAALDAQERASQRLLRLPNPDNPGKGADTLLVTCRQDAVEPNLWHLCPWHLRHYGGRLPATLTTAEVEPLTAAASWP
jgi:hypothetical protein